MEKLITMLPDQIFCKGILFKDIIFVNQSAYRIKNPDRVLNPCQG